MDKDTQDDKKCHGLRHGLLMVVCCALPIVLAVALAAMGYTTYASYVAILLCPLLHLVMMRGHKHD